MTNKLTPFFLIIVSIITGCNATKNKTLSPYRFPNLKDEVEVTLTGGLVKSVYKGKTMHFCEQMFSENKSICISTMYCGYGTAPYLVKVRLYSEVKMVEHSEWGYSYFREEHVPFRQEYIATNDPMVLTIEERNENGDMVKTGYISQWEAEEFYNEFCKANKITVKWNPETVIEKVTSIIPQ